MDLLKFQCHFLLKVSIKIKLEGVPTQGLIRASFIVPLYIIIDRIIKQICYTHYYKDNTIIKEGFLHTCHAQHIRNPCISSVNSFCQAWALHFNDVDDSSDEGGLRIHLQTVICFPLQDLQAGSQRRALMSCTWQTPGDSYLFYY